MLTSYEMHLKNKPEFGLEDKELEHYYNWLGESKFSELECNHFADKLQEDLSWVHSDGPNSVYQGCRDYVVSIALLNAIKGHDTQRFKKHFVDSGKQLSELFWSTT